MTIVLPGRCRSALYSPPKSLKDARHTLGSIYTEARLVECSQNAFELTKHLKELESLEKKKAKIIEDIQREQRILINSLKTTKGPYATERDERKVETPGFRYHANGELKEDPRMSKSELLLEDLDLMFTEVDKSSTIHEQSAVDITANRPSLTAFCIGYNGSKANQGHRRSRTSNMTVNYEKEISELETVMRDISDDLRKHRIDLHTGKSSSDKIKTYLRGSSKQRHVTLPPESVHLETSSAPNDRFAFRPGSSSKISASNKEERRRGDCMACQCRVKRKAQGYTPRLKSESRAFERKWHQAPRGKFLQSSHSIPVFNLGRISSTPKLLLDRTVSENRETKANQGSSITIGMNRAPSFGNGKPQSTETKPLPTSLDLQRGKSTPVLAWASNTKDFPVREGAVSSLTLGSATYSDLGKRLSSSPSISLTKRSSAKISVQHLLQHEARMNEMKSRSKQEGLECDRKVKDFLHKLSEDQKRSSTSVCN